MTIWLLALLLLASVAGLGYRQGGVRVAFSLVGILLGALLAAPLSRVVKPLLGVFGLRNPTLLWLLAPFIAFLVVSIICKVAAFPVYQKIDVYFRYHTGDLRFALWERLNHRLGLCLGLVNGVVYLLLIACVIYAFSYWTIQLSSGQTNSRSEGDPKMVRLINRLGRDLNSSGFASVARALDPMPQVYYDTADVAGLIYHNSLLEARLARYPAFLSLAERPEFQALATDQEFNAMRAQQEPIRKVLNHYKVQAILKDPDLVRLIWATVVPELKELTVFLETGKSAKYASERILGRWNFDANATARAYRRAKPNISSSDMLKFRNWLQLAFSKTSMVAMTDHQIIVKNLPQIRAGAAAPGVGPQTLSGQWKEVDGRYQFSLSGGGGSEELTATIEGDRLTIKSGGYDLVFIRED